MVINNRIPASGKGLPEHPYIVQRMFLTLKMLRQKHRSSENQVYQYTLPCEMGLFPTKADNARLIFDLNNQAHNNADQKRERNGQHFQIGTDFGCQFHLDI